MIEYNNVEFFNGVKIIIIQPWYEDNVTWLPMSIIIYVLWGDKVLYQKKDKWFYEYSNDLQIILFTKLKEGKVALINILDVR
jgi:hypothetical protein